MQRFRHLIQFGAYRALLVSARLLPHGWARAYGRLWGTLAYALGASSRRQALWNLERALPELDATARRSLARRGFRELGASSVDTLSAGRYSGEQLLARTELVGLDHYEEAARSGKGVLLVGAHLGCFEVAAWILGTRLGGMHVVSDVLSNPRFDRELQRRRARYGLRTLLQSGAGRRMFKVLEEGGRVMMTLDQRTRREDAIAASFFGLVSLTSPLPAYVAQLLGAPTVPVYATMAGGGYRVEIEPPLWPTGRGRQGVAELTQRLLDRVEEQIRRRPEAWIWHYRRWRPEWDDPAQVGSSLALRPAASAPETGDEGSR